MASKVLTREGKHLSHIVLIMPKKANLHQNNESALREYRTSCDGVSGNSIRCMTNRLVHLDKCYVSLEEL